MGAQAPLGVPDQFLAGEPPHALHESALDLATIDRRIERSTDIVQHVGAQQLRLAGEGVDRHLGHRSAIGEVIERTPLQGGRIKAHLGYGVETRAR